MSYVEMCSEDCWTCWTFESSGVSLCWMPMLTHALNVYHILCLNHQQNSTVHGTMDMLEYYKDLRMIDSLYTCIYIYRHFIGLKLCQNPNMSLVWPHSWKWSYEWTMLICLTFLLHCQEWHSFNIWKCLCLDCSSAKTPTRPRQKKPFWKTSCRCEITQHVYQECLLKHVSGVIDPATGGGKQFLKTHLQETSWLKSHLVYLLYQFRLEFHLQNQNLNKMQNNDEKKQRFRKGLANRGCWREKIFHLPEIQASLLHPFPMPR